ncbi:non-hydrolyzing UDP-N-acetylglucosamine 2-epimerase [Cecembia lonarensis]|uniref:UDP-N-acetylglucosamine 2-epimerase n=1 Tax=Cecembia lonarensis (strain CCUG 58316 / KCTC 22772 / LW9) TaxID=1225176 RepID=K1LYF4_CECL9|nr:UDP-N-acetylglucosamine 2-epimerase (non-hydrolyzing) [Cecembia lonarensis]EKB49144.1 UDP-N-acetylglucosamine 2-epimerase [Cecembia lonarensis LW9]
MQKLKVMTVVGTRPEIIRLSRVMAALDASPAIEHITVHTGQNYDYELNEVFYEDLGVRKPDYFLNAAGATATATVGQILINIDPILEEVKPDAFLVLGDTNSCLCAIPAKKRHIPIFHMEAGNRCFDQRVPEETNRKIVDHISDINLTYSDIAREYLLREGLPADRIIKTGSPMYEVLNHYMPKIQASDILDSMGLEQGKYFVVSAHREENISNDKNFFALLESLNQIAERYGYPIIVSTHPRTRKHLEQLNPQKSAQSESLVLSETEVSAFHLNPLIQWQKPMGFSDYNALQINAFAVLSDSGTISEESSIMNFRALNIREAHERPEAMEEASVMMVGLNPERILQGLAQLERQAVGLRNKSSENEKISNDSLITNHQSLNTTFQQVSDYSMPNVSDKMVRIILSYTSYIKRVVWSE